MIEKHVVVRNKLGLHARPSALLAKTANLFRSSIMLTHGKRTVDAKSILGLMTMALPCGTEIVIATDGPDETAAAERIAELFESRFGEAE